MPFEATRMLIELFMNSPGFCPQMWRIFTGAKITAEQRFGIGERLFAATLSPSLLATGEGVNIPASADALTKRCFQTGWSIVFSQQIAELFVCKGREVIISIAGPQSDR